MERPKAKDIREKIIYHSNEIIKLTNLLRRNSPIRKAKPDSKTMTRSIANNIREIARNNPDISYKAIANLVGVNQGRVSDVLCKRGRWKKE